MSTAGDIVDDGYKKKEDLEVVLMCPSFVEIPFRIERRYEFYVTTY
jgi:hypothetical protein